MLANSRVEFSGASRCGNGLLFDLCHSSTYRLLSLGPQGDVYDE